MMALFKSFSLMIICDIFSLLILTYLRFSWVGKPILDSSVTSSKLSHTISTLIPQLLIWRATSSSLIDSLVLQINLYIVFHICPRNRHHLNQMACVSFVSKCMVLQLATCTSLQRALTVSKVLPTYLLRSKSWIQAGQFTTTSQKPM